MPNKTFYATRDMKDPFYRTRMLRAGDPVIANARLGKVFEKMGHLTSEKPARLVRAEERAAAKAAAADETVVREVVEAPATAQTRKRRTTRKKR